MLDRARLDRAVAELPEAEQAFFQHSSFARARKEGSAFLRSRRSPGGTGSG